MIHETHQLLSLLPYFFFIGALTAYIAKTKKNRPPFFWFFIGFFFGLFGLFSLFFMEKKQTKQDLLHKLSQQPPMVLIKNAFSLPWYYVNEQNLQEGPISAKRLATLIENDTIGNDTLVWNEKLDEWKTIKELPEYIQILKN